LFAPYTEQALEPDRKLSMFSPDWPTDQTMLSRKHKGRPPSKQVDNNFVHSSVLVACFDDEPSLSTARCWEVSVARRRVYTMMRTILNMARQDRDRHAGERGPIGGNPGVRGPDPRPGPNIQTNSPRHRAEPGMQSSTSGHFRRTVAVGSSSTGQARHMSPSTPKFNSVDQIFDLRSPSVVQSLDS
jgi:hypothetical protein